jgi:hypothetical protein
LDADGLHQYTKDDLKSEGDALDNLNEDSPMSNYICETDFTLQKKSFSISKPSIIITATDGCFGYLPSPMHFEYLLLWTMQNSSTKEVWKQKLTSEIVKVSSDDATLSLYFTWKDFEPLKKDFKDRFKKVEKDIKSIEDAEEEKRDAIIRTQWEKYKKEYEKYDKTATSAGAEKSSDASEPPRNSEKSSVKPGISAVNSSQKNIPQNKKNSSDEKVVGKKDSSKPAQKKESAEKSKKDSGFKKIKKLFSENEEVIIPFIFILVLISLIVLIFLIVTGVVD